MASTSSAKKLIWHKGPPPHVGWWNASKTADVSCWRWWNGMNWSQPAYRSFSKKDVASAAKEVSSRQNVIFWTDHYPANARVPRVAP